MTKDRISTAIIPIDAGQRCSCNAKKMNPFFMVWHQIKGMLPKNHASLKYLVSFAAILLCSNILGNSLELEGQTLTSYSRVIIISYDGLRPDILTSLGKENLPNFYRVMNEGVFTLNARSDPDWTITMPNHTCMLTGRGVNGKKGHNYTDNSKTENSIHLNKGSYVRSIFDAAKANRKKSGFFASKAKFKVFADSYNPDVSMLTQSDTQTFNNLIYQMNKGLPEVNFVHFANTDEAGHAYGWGSSKYLDEVLVMDKRLGAILDKINSTDYLHKTVLIITADHGGNGFGHSDNQSVLDYRIPFLAWARSDLPKGRDLYRVNKKNGRKNPGVKQLPYKAKFQPIRNGDAANAAMKILELKPVKGSTIGKKNPLIIKVIK